MDHNNNNNNTNSSSNGASQPQSPPTFPPNVFYVNYHFTFAPSSTAPATPSPGFPPPATDDAEQSPQQQQQQQQQGPANPFQGFFFYTIPGGAPVAGQAGTDNNPFEFFEEPPKPRASKNAVAALKDVDLDAIPEADRTCSICFEPYSAGKSGPKQAESKCAHDEEHNDESKATADAATAESADAADEKKSEAEDDHAPLQMPCGHIFGRSCLKEWLASSTTCPLCRTAIEAEAQEPRQSAPRATFFFQNGLPFLVGPLFNIIAGARGARGPNPHPASASAQNPAQTGAGENASPETSSEATTTQTPSGTTTASEESGASTPASQDQAQRGPSISRSLSFTLSARNRNHPYLRRSAPSSSTNLPEQPTPSTTASSTPSTSTTLPPLATVLARPDLECGSAPMGLCEESGPYMRLTCGHGFHEDCLRSAMRSHGDADIPNLRSDEDVSTSDIERPQVRREVWCMRCRRYVAVDV